MRHIVVHWVCGPDRQTDRQTETYSNGALFDGGVEGDGYGDTPATV